MHLTPAPWTPLITSQAKLLEELAAGKEFTVTDIGDVWCGSTTTAKELIEQGITKVQIRYGKNNTKVWYGKLPREANV